MNVQHQFQKCHVAVRSAFTLVETILALGLSAILLSAVYTAMDQSWKMSARGREEMERAQLARALIQRIELDIRAMTFEPPPPTDDTATGGMTITTTTSSTASTQSGNSGSGASGSLASASSSSADSSADVVAPNSKSLGLRGTAVQLEISTSRPRHDLLPGLNSNPDTMTASDLRTVIYSFQAAGTSGISGLVRIEGERMAVDMIEATGGMATQISTAQPLAPEVMSLTFRYFDGRVWMETWDTATVGRIPRAVEVQFRFFPPRRKAPLFQTAVSPTMDAFRTVILIPVSDPFPKEFVE